MQIGSTIFIFNRRFLLHDCDSFTRKYYSDMLGIIQPEKIPLPTENDVTILPEYKSPPHIIFGTPEDTYASCLSFIPERPKKDVIRQLVNFPKKLRYSMQMDVIHPEDKNRDFILEYSLSNGTILIQELEKRNSGRREGCFLRATLVPKPKTGRDDPEYYTPQDFYIGAKINIFNHYFIITGTDLFVYRYIETNPEKFPLEVRNSIRNYLVKQNLLSDDIKVETKKIQDKEDIKLQSIKPAEVSIKRDIDMEECVEHFEAQTKCKYEGEHGELRPHTPPPEELCPNLATKPTQLSQQCPNIFTENKIKKRITWDDGMEQ